MDFEIFKIAIDSICLLNLSACIHIVYLYSIACGEVMINEQRVIAGVNAKEGRWPWQILMLMGGSPGCGGSIIGPRHVVTAAHCVDGYEGWPSYFSVR